MSSSDAQRQLLADGPSEFQPALHDSQISPLSEQAPIKPTRNVFREVCSFIIIAEFCERLAYYGLTGSLTIFFKNNLELSSALSTELSSGFVAFNYITPLLGAYLADTYLGRFTTIWTFCALYVVGMVMCTVAALPDSTSSSLFFVGLMGGVAVGSGGIKPNVVVLGADQFNPDDPEEELQKESFFNYFYWSINIGAVVSFGFLAYLAVNGLGPVPKEWGFFASFLIPTIAMALAVLTFLSGSSRYVKKPPEGSALGTFCSLALAGASRSKRGMAVLFGVFIMVPGVIITVVSYFVDSETAFILAVTGGVIIVLGMLLLVVFSAETSWLSYLREELDSGYSEDEIDDVADVLRLLPYVGYLIMFWAVYQQMSGSFVLQGCQMDLRIGSGTISSAMLNLFDCTVILAFIPLFDGYVYPFFEARGMPLTPLRKVGTGFIFCALSMMCAAYVEIKRRESPLIVVGDNNVTGLPIYLQSNCDASIYMSDFSVWYQIPQYLLIGIGEILTAITTYDLFYSQVPASMRSVCQALNLLTVTLGSMVSSAVLSILKSWYTDNLNDGKLDYIFFVFAAMMLMNLIGFVFTSQSFEYKLQHAAVEDMRRSRSMAAAGMKSFSRSMTAYSFMTAADDLSLPGTPTAAQSSFAASSSAARSWSHASFLKASFMGSGTR